MQTQVKPTLQELIAARQWGELRGIVREWEAADLAERLVSLPKTDRVLLFRALPRPLAADTFSYLQPPDRDALLRELTDGEVRNLLANLAPDDRTELLAELPGQVTQRLLNLLNPADLQEARTLLGYPEESVGRLMTPDYVAVRPDWTVLRALAHIRKRGNESETVDRIYVVDGHWHLIGDVALRRLILADPEQTIAEIMSRQPASLPATADREQAVLLMQRYGLQILPVVDSDGVLVGIVTFDDVLSVAQEEATEDVQRLGGSQPLREPYLHASVFDIVRKRVGWLMLLFVAAAYTGSVVGHFTSEIERYAGLAVFMPLLIGTGGNVAAQTVMTVIGAMAVGEVGLGDVLRVMSKEVMIGMCLGILIGVATYLRVFVQFVDPRLSLAVGFSAVFIVIWAATVAAILPMALRRAGVDPAVVSAPFITTLVDGTGLFIYFELARYVLKL